ncbi:MAG: galactose-1-epimerase, partial [Phototrophicales bacterium]
MKEGLFTSPKLSARSFGQLPDGRVVDLWTLKGDHGFEVSLNNLGATVTRIITPDREGRLADVVLGFE